MKQFLSNKRDTPRLSSLEYSLLNSSNFKGRFFTLSEGSTVYRAGDTAFTFYMILEGAVEIARTKKLRVVETTIAEENEFFGIEELLQKTKREATVTAIVDTKLIEFSLVTDRNTHLNLIKESPLAELSLKSGFKLTSIVGPVSTVIAEKTEGTTTILTLNLHRCTYALAAEFKQYMFEAIDRGVKNVVIDLQQCRIIDSTFLGALVASLRKINSYGGDLRLVCNQQIYSWLFLVTGMDKVFKIFTELNKAIASIQ